MKKVKFPKFGSKIALFETFSARILKNIIIFEISTHEFVKLQNFKKKSKCVNLGPKMPYLDIFVLEFENNIEYCHI